MCIIKNNVTEKRRRIKDDCSDNFSTDRFEAAVEKSNSFELVSSDGGERDGLSHAKVLQLFWMSARKDSENREYALLQYLEVTRTIDMVEETSGYVSLR